MTVGYYTCSQTLKPEKNLQGEKKCY